MFGVGRDLCGSSSPTPRKSQALLVQHKRVVLSKGKWDEEMRWIDVTEF